MKIIFSTLTFFFSLIVFGQPQTDEQKRDIAFYKATNKWFAAWKSVSKDIYQLDKVRPVEFVFLMTNTFIQLLQQP